MSENEKTETTDAAESEQSAPLGGEKTDQQETVERSSYSKVADQLEDDAAQEGIELDNDSEESDDSGGMDIADDEIDALADEILSELDEDTQASDTTETDDNKDGFKKGLEKLKAERDQAKAENAELKEKLSRLDGKLDLLLDKKKPDENSEKKSVKLTDKELTDAISQCMEENDAQGMKDVFEYLLQERDEKLRDEYRSEQNQKIAAAQQKQVEWQSIIKDYSKDSYDNELLNENPDFNINNEKSKLYQLSEQLYMNGVKANDQKYLKQGGMRTAVDEAFVKLLKSIVGKAKSTKKEEASTDGLKNRLAKEQRKNSSKSGASDSGGEDNSAPKNKTQKDELAEVLRERSEQKNSRTAGV